MADTYNFIEYTPEVAAAIRKARDLPTRGDGQNPWPEHNRQQLLPPMMSDSENLPGHPFDATLINKGTEENPNYYVKIYDSSLPDSPYAGVVSVYEWDMSVPVTELAVTTDGGFFVALDITYVEGGNPPFSIQPSLLPYGYGVNVGYLTAREYIAQGKIPNVASRVSGDIYVTGRWA